MMTIHQGGEEATSQRIILPQLEWAFPLRCMSLRKFRPIGKDKNFKKFLEFVTVGVGVPAPVHESFQHDVVNGMLLSKDERVSTK